MSGILIVSKIKKIGFHFACLAFLSPCTLALGNEICVSIGRHQISFNEDLLAFPPTLKGVNYWGKHEQRISEKAKCEDQVSDITIHFSWPLMHPAGNTVISNILMPGRVSVSIKPLEKTPLDVGYFKDFYTLSAHKSQKQSVKYDPKLKLYGYRGNHGAVSGLHSYYWADNSEGKPWYFMMCTPLPDGQPYKCKGHYFLDTAQSIIVVSFPAQIVNDWELIIRNTNKLIANSLKK